MEVHENKANTQVVNHGRRCTICDHDGVRAIDSLLASATLSNRRIAAQYGFTERAVRNHKDNHVSARLNNAAKRREIQSEDVFMNRHEHLYRESLQYIEDAKDAVKMQRTTVEVETPEGMKLVERYEAFRDVGAMAPALTTAIQLQRLYGDATQQFLAAAPGTTNISLTMVLPRAELPKALPEAQVIDTNVIDGDATEE